ncbi:MAG TPA: FkbM family methyltransferase [Geminocystis sp. M7585_C2015_104]|nr:FkbM family methyltransferase [Geminocystis sp. M7585_C2015_104]
MSSNSPTRGIASYLADLPLFRRLKTVKDLILEKLDNIVENDTSSLEALIEIAEAIIVLYDTIYTQQSEIINLIEKNKSSIFKSIENQNKQLSVANVNLKEVAEKLSQILDSVHSSYNELFEKIKNSDSILQQSIPEITIRLEKLNQETTRLKETLECVTTSEKKTKENQVENIKPSPIVVSISKAGLKHPEMGLMGHLYSFLPSRKAIDVGANIGEVSECLLRAGYEVYSFEPYLPTYEKLKSRLSHYPQFHCYPFALGNENTIGNLYLATDKTATKIYGDDSLYHSLIPHSMPENLSFTETVTVTVKTFASLQKSGILPTDIGLVKIDTEGFDLQVIRGMGETNCPVIITEFWDECCPFGKGETFNRLPDLVFEMRQRGYHWHIVIYRIWGREKISFYCNQTESLENSWGNVFFFKDYNLFSQAYRWVAFVLPETYLV